MSITYTNRKGKKHYLHQGLTKTEKPRYYFSREQRDNSMDEIPAGYEITESVNGIVSLSKARPRLILDDEIRAVKKAIEKHPKGRKYRINTKSKEITIYENIGLDGFNLAGILAKKMGFSRVKKKKINELWEKEFSNSAQYTPVMRFILSDEKKRIFRAERMCYLGRSDWIDIGYEKTIKYLADTFIPLLGTEDFFELW